jgi:SAM-dependent methyltransferase
VAIKKLNFGCGNDLREGWDNADIQKSQRVQKSFDFNKFPYPIKDNTYDYIFASNVLEHLEDVERVIIELWRIAKPGGIMEIIVPHYTNKGAYSDLQHKHYFNEVCFTELAEKNTKIDKSKNFAIIELKLVPTFPGKLLPEKLRNKLSLFFGGLISSIRIRLKVIK